MIFEQKRSVARFGHVQRTLLLIASTVCMGLPQIVLARDYRIAPAPDWVTPVERGAVDTKRFGQIADGAYYLLSDTQVRLDAGTRTGYRRIASVATNAAGVSTLANIEIGFDPAFQTLELHSIDLVRGGRVIPKLATATVRILQRETELERRIFDGSKSASIFLEDVRVGDIVDYAYTIRGSNPVFKGREFGTMSLQFSVPVGRIHARLLASVGQDVSVVPRNSDIETSVSGTNGVREYRWNVLDAPPLNPDDDAPGWYDPYPVVQWSAFRDWAAVNRWAQPLYAIPRTSGAPLNAEIEHIRKAESTAKGRMLAALRLVQREIRYLGVEIGPGSHEPNPPDLVFERRFGDCKDKTLLTLTLLDRLGIRARAALVNTQRGRALADRQPSPGQFDHVVVRAELDGRTIWLDPTRATQNADLEHVVQPDFDLALVVAPGTDRLVSMTPPVKPGTPRRIHVTFDASAGLEEPVDFSVVTTVEGERAESMRYTLATASFEEVQRTYLNFYAGYFPDLAIAEPMRVDDDERNNRMVLTEHYRIPKFSDWSEASKRHTADIPAPDVDELLRSPKSPVRNSPLRLAHPSDVTVITETVLPGQWTIEPSTIRVDDPAFTYERTVKPKGERFFITDRFRTLSDEVAAADTQRYVGNLARARSETAYQLYWGKATPASVPTGIDRINWTLVVIALLALVFWIGLAVRVYRHDPPAHRATRPHGARGLGGWLVLPGFGILVMPLATSIHLYQGLEAWAADSWANLTTFGSPAYHSLWAPVLLFELVGLLGVLVFSILLAILFFRCRSSLPRVYIGFQWVAALQMLIDHVLVAAIPAADSSAFSTPQLVGALIGTVIWTLYFLRSERVRNTFVERLAKERLAMATPAVPREAFSI